MLMTVKDSSGGHQEDKSTKLPYQSEYTFELAHDSSYDSYMYCTWSEKHCMHFLSATMLDYLHGKFAPTRIDLKPLPLSCWGSKSPFHSHSEHFLQRIFVPRQWATTGFGRDAVLTLHFCGSDIHPV